MQRWGTTAAGSVRWRCLLCLKTATRKRPDRKVLWAKTRFARWVLGKQTYTEHAAKQGIQRTTLSRQFSPFLGQEPESVWDGSCTPTLALDAIRVVRHQTVLLIAVDTVSGKPVDWMLAEREHFASWCTFLTRLQSRGIMPKGTVSDAQKGLLKALRTIFPDSPHQRCLIHLHRQACIWLTQHPKSEAGQDLLLLTHQLIQVKTRNQATTWEQSFITWIEKYQPFLAERTLSETSKKWWYTHRKLRATRSLLKNALPDMFTFLTYSQIPRTSNHVEGGINARLRELLRCHRGLTPPQQRSFSCWFLVLKQEEKPTRNVT